MTIYVDVLLSINIIIDYFLINITGGLLKTKCKLSRQILGALLGALCSLTILIPISLGILSYIIRVITAPIIIFTVYGKANIKLFLLRVICFLLCSFTFSGFFFILFQVFEPQNLVVRGGVVYYNLSATVLVLASLVAYIIISLISRFFKSNSGIYKKVLVVCNETKILLNCLVDTGSNLKEPFSEKPVLLINRRFSASLDTNGLLERIIPFYTASGEGLLVGFRPTSAKLIDDKTETELDIYISFSESNFQDGIEGILPYYAINIV